MNESPHAAETEAEQLQTFARRRQTFGLFQSRRQKNIIASGIHTPIICTPEELMEV
jgi:hypothetical protein